MPFKNYFLLYSILLSTSIIAQIQIGQNINGEAAADASGHMVALNVDGTIVAISAITNDGNGSNAGHVRIYGNQGDNWVQLGQDIDGEQQGELFGSAISINGSGTIVAIGYPSNDSQNGRVKIYEYDSSTDAWNQLGQTIVATNIKLGRSVSLSGSGDIIAIGATEFGPTEVGQIRVYQNINGSWVPLGQFIEGDVDFGKLGQSLSLSADGNTFVAGAPGFNEGYAKVYSLQNGNWLQVGNTIDGIIDDRSTGRALSLNSNGSIIAIGDPDNDTIGNNSGQVRMYENQGNSWVQIGLGINGTADGDRFGSALSLNSDGTIVVIGSRNNDDSAIDAGKTSAYRLIGDDWNLLGQSILGSAEDDLFGWAVSIDASGLVIAASAPGNDDNGVSAGQVRMFDLSSTLSTSTKDSINFDIAILKNELTISNFQKYHLTNIQLYDMTGRQVLMQDLNGNPSQIKYNLSFLNTGVYLLKINTPERYLIQKIIRN